MREAVVASERLGLAKLLNDAKLHLGQLFSRSLRTGIGAVPNDWQAAIVCLGDMPGITPALLRALVARAGASAIVVPVFAGRRGNPVLWGRDHFTRLATLDGDTGGKPLLAVFAERIIDVAADSDSVLTDIDTPAALERARSRPFKTSVIPNARLRS